MRMVLQKTAVWCVVHVSYALSRKIHGLHMKKFPSDVRASGSEVQDVLIY